MSINASIVAARLLSFSIRATASFLLLTWAIGIRPILAQDAGDEDPFVIERTIASKGFDGKTCWVHARAGAIPSVDGEPRVVMTTQKLLLSGSDVFFALHESETSDGGATWTPLTPRDSFGRRTFGDSTATIPGAATAPGLLQKGDQTTVCDFVPQWHAASQRLLGIGQTVWYRNNRVMHVRPRGVAYAVYDTKASQWKPWNVLTLPNEPKFQSAGAGSAQRLDLPGGDILLPIYFKEPRARQYSVTVVRCRFDGRKLHYVDHGNELTIPVKRGLYEPSITRVGRRYFLTMRNDDHGYVSTSDDGREFSKPRRWTFDDGTDLGNYNTQQHWITHGQRLFLAYTRRGADNDHVFRHRAPLFIAEVDSEKLHVIRASERVLVPERGARLGNFGVTRISDHETWVTVTEWMQPRGVEKHGSDNKIFVAKLRWKKPQGASADYTNNEVLGWYQQPGPVALWPASQNEYKGQLQFDDGSPVKTKEQWSVRREQIRTRWMKDLGQWPPLLTEQRLQRGATMKRDDGVTQIEVRFRWTPKESTRGYLLLPPRHREAAASQRGKTLPGVITVFYEPETAVGQGRPHRDFAIQLASRGFVTLSLGTTEATDAKTYALYHPSIDDAKVAPLSMLGCAAANAWHALANEPLVDSERIGIVGHSFGGKWAMFGSCLFDKFACAAWSDPGIVFDTRPSVNYWEPWYLGYHPKPWRKRGVVTADNPARGLYARLLQQQRDLHELHALMAPRPFVVSGGSEDPVHRWSALESSRSVNRLLGHDDRVLMTNRPDHSPNADSNDIIYRFFERWLLKR